MLPVGLHPAGLQGRTCPASKLKKEPGVRDRDIHGLMDGGAYVSEARSWSDTPPCAVDGGQDMAAVCAGGGGWVLPVIGEIDVRLAHWLPGKSAEGQAPHHPYDSLSE